MTFAINSTNENRRLDKRKRETYPIGVFKIRGKLRLVTGSWYNLLTVFSFGRYQQKCTTLLYSTKCLEVREILLEKSGEDKMNLQSNKEMEMNSTRTYMVLKLKKKYIEPIFEKDVNG